MYKLTKTVLYVAATLGGSVLPGCLEIVRGMLVSEGAFDRLWVELLTEWAGAQLFG